MIKDDSNDIARRIRDCKEEDLARIISEIRSSPSTSEDLFQDSSKAEELLKMTADTHDIIKDKSRHPR
ncbi:hypothetical protein Tco_1472925 [Tanacetum coccineum]